MERNQSGELDIVTRGMVPLFGSERCFFGVVKVVDDDHFPFQDVSSLLLSFYFFWVKKSLMHG